MWTCCDLRLLDTHQIALIMLGGIQTHVSLHDQLPAVRTLDRRQRRQPNTDGQAGIFSGAMFQNFTSVFTVKVIKMKTSISEYTETDFLNFVISLCDASARTEEEDDEMLLEFTRLTEHPNGSDLVYYPRDDREDSPEGIVKEVKEWRAANGKPGFKVE